MSILRCSHDASDMGYGTPKARTRQAAVHRQWNHAAQETPSQSDKMQRRTCRCYYFFPFSLAFPNLTTRSFKAMSSRDPYVEDENNNDSSSSPFHQSGDEAPEGMRYAADTRQQPVSSSNGDAFATSAEAAIECGCTHRTRGYLPIENYGIIGNMRTVALCGTDGSIDFLCYPRFDSPSIFCRLLDKDKGGHFSITPDAHASNKQQYMPSSNILVTRFLSEDGVAEVVDYMHVPAQNQRLSTKPLLPWVIRIVKVIRGQVNFRMECYPAFNYALDEHTTASVPYTNKGRSDFYPEDDISHYAAQESIVFKSKDLTMDLRHIVKCGDFECPKIDVHIDHKYAEKGLKGPGAYSEFTMKESQEATFILREVPEPPPAGKPFVLDPPLSISLMDALFRQTVKYWQEWLAQSCYRGRWRENVQRSALTLKLLTYEPVNNELPFTKQFMS